jgi:hypothetical protein
MVFSLLAIDVHGQAAMTYSTADSLTYKLYEQGKWQELIQKGNIALGQGHDYYYMRMRLGIAHFSLHHYRKAAVHFEKALEFNSTDLVALKYLKQCYAWGGMDTEAAALNKRFAGINLGSGEKSKFFKEIMIYGGASKSGSAGKLSEIDIAGERGIYGEVNLSENMFFLHAATSYSPQPHLRWFAGFTSIFLSKHQRIVAAGTDTMNHQYRLRQSQVFASLPIQYARGWQIIPAMNLISINDKPLLMSFDTLNSEYIATTNDTNLINYVFSFKVVKDWPYLAVGTAFGYSKLNHNEQLQLSLDLNIYPFANLNLYTFSRIAATYENGQLQNHFKQTIGGRITSWLWLQASHHGGKMKNAHDENGLLVFNTAGQIRSRTSATAYILLSKKLTFQIDYGFVKQQDDYLEYVDYENFILKPVQYNNHHIMGGIKWKL